MTKSVDFNDLREIKSKLINTMSRIIMTYETPTDVETSTTPTVTDAVEIVSVGNELEMISDSVSSVRCILDSLTTEITVLNVVFGAGGSIALHKHPDNWEYIYVLDGSITDTVTNITTPAGFTYKIPPGTPHHIVSDYALLTVTFKPKFKNIPIE
jgi:quercetin dioxygenase-like cupin family protein